MINLLPLKSILEAHSSFLITCHVNPDADAIGSEMMLYHILRTLGKDVTILNYSKTPYYLEFLDPGSNIVVWDEANHKELINSTDVIFALDFNMWERTVKMEPYFRKTEAITVCIDHHEQPENAFDYRFENTGYCATGHILYDFIKQSNIVEFTPAIAEACYAAIMTDTGSFKYERTTPEVHNIAAHLLELGVNPTDMYEKIFHQSRFSKMKLLGNALDSLQLFGEHKGLAVMTVRRKTLHQLNALENDTEGFVNHCLSIEGVKIGLFFLEVEVGFKVSLRSKGDIPIHKLAQEFGGGGHKNAAGLRVRDKSLDDLFPDIIQRAIEYLKM